MKTILEKNIKSKINLNNLYSQKEIEDIKAIMPKINPYYYRDTIDIKLNMKILFLLFIFVFFSFSFSFDSIWLIISIIDCSN